MSAGVVGTKLGMSRVFTEQGESIPVTVIQVQPNFITQIKRVETDGYSAIQVSTGQADEKRITAPARGSYHKASVAPGRGFWEFRMTPDEIAELSVGDAIEVSRFAPGDKVDVRGISQGKGFAGVMKRYGFGGGRATHGNSKAHRKPGSIGQNQSPSRVFPGKKMAGHLGNVKKVQQNLEIAKVDEARALLLVKGSVPGCRNSRVMVTGAVKQKSASR